MAGGWPSGWEVYYVLFLSGILALALPAVLVLVSSLVRHKRQSPVHDTLPTAATTPETVGEFTMGRLFRPSTALLSESGAREFGRVNTRFFLGANAALVLISFGLILVPCVGTLQESAHNIVGPRGLWVILSLVVFATLGLLYSARKGDLNWLKSYNRESK